MFPGHRPASVTVNPEVHFTGPLKHVFPGSRSNATADPLRDGDKTARKHTPLPFGLPFGSTVTVDKTRDRDSAQTNNTKLGGEHGEAGVFGTGASHQGATDPEHH